MADKKIKSELILEASLDKLEDAFAFFNQALEEAGIKEDIQFKIQIAVEEIFVNIASYAYPKASGNAKLTFQIEENPKRIIMEFYDKGIPYNPLEKPDPNVNEDVMERTIGGLGIYMVKESMDDMQYKYEDDQNILILVKNLE